MKNYKELSCDTCGVIFNPTGPRQKRCEPCGSIHDRSWDKARSARRHGMTDEIFSQLFAKGCAICHRPFTESPHVDHDHSHCSGRFGCERCLRGLLCKFCNNGFVYAIESNPELRKFVAPEILEYIDKLQKTAGDLLPNDKIIRTR